MNMISCSRKKSMNPRLMLQLQNIIDDILQDCRGKVSNKTKHEEELLYKVTYNGSSFLYFPEN